MNTLISIGNDIVDLSADDCHATLNNTRFIERVFTEREQAVIQSAPDSHQTLWAMWACKESAYKAVKRVESGTIFAHRSFEVNAECTLVSYAGKIILCQAIISGENIFATAALNGELENIQSLRAINPHAGDSDSVFTRRLLTQVAAETYSLPENSFEVIKVAGSGAPVLLHAGVTFSTAVSLTHHGRYCAASIYCDPRHISS